MNYVDYKTIVWQRAHFAPGINMEEVVDVIKEGSFNNIFNDELGFTENEILYSTENYLTVAENDYTATIEVFQDDEEIFNNLYGYDTN